jgi:hypothetical protein
MYMSRWPACLLSRLFNWIAGFIKKVIISLNHLLWGPRETLSSHLGTWFMQKLSQVIFETYLRAFIPLQKSDPKSKDTKEIIKIHTHTWSTRLFQQIMIRDHVLF